MDPYPIDERTQETNRLIRENTLGAMVRRSHFPESAQTAMEKGKIQGKGILPFRKLGLTFSLKAEFRSLVCISYKQMVGCH